MGDCAESLCNGEVDFYTGEWLDGDSPGYPRTMSRNGVPGPLYTPLTPSEKKIRAVRIELAKLIKYKKKLASTPGEKNNVVNQCRQEINLKYGKTWRTRGLYPGPNQWTEEELAPFKRKRNGKA